MRSNAKNPNKNRKTRNQFFTKKETQGQFNM